MAIADPTLADFAVEWERYQDLLIGALAPLTAEQLELRAAPHLRSIGDIATHIVGARARWLRRFLGEGGDDLDAIMPWDRAGQPPRTATELVDGLRRTWAALHACLERWTEADLAQHIERQYQGETESLSRRWVIWHLIEHDLHHGGEVSFSLGMHGLAALDL
ncbi:MAG TPA: DinB family protein [Ktedonobacterales bacterium]|nr:DinB family protein [Ktedonobacterales bacterium]